MEDDILARKEEAFLLFDLVEQDDSEQDNSQQAALNMFLPPRANKPISSSRASAPTKLLRSHTSPVSRIKTYTAQSKPAQMRRKTEPTRSKPSTKAQLEVIVIGDTSSDDDDSDIEVLGGTAPQRVVPSTHIGVPRPITGEKRKRHDPIPQLKEQRFFEGCYMFFFPNNDNGMHRVGMVKSGERGAAWVKMWHANSTHVVVEDHLTYEGLMKELGLVQLPEHVALVNSTYIPDCIGSRALRDPREPQFRVKGAPTPWLAAPKAPMPARPELAPSSPRKIRSTGKEATRRAENTPDRESPERFLSDDEVSTSSEAAAPETAPTLKKSTDHRSAVSDDDLDQAIAEAKQTKGLPLDRDDDLDKDGNGGDGLESRHNSAQSERVPHWQKNFSCMQDPKSRSTSSDGPNAHIVDLLQQMGKYYDSVRDQWRTLAYRKAVSRLKHHPTEVATKEDALKLPGIGDRLATKIEEIHRTSRLRRLENALLEPEDQALKIFLSIYQVGFTQAQAWVRQGLRTLDDLKKHKVPLTSNQQIGVDHYEDFNTRIPRAEVTKLGEVVIRTLKNIDPAFEAMIGGSYRRGSADSGDIDVLITHPTNTLGYTRTLVLDTLVPRLEKKRFLVAGLAVTSREDGSKWHGACVLPQDEAHAGGHRPWRRIDLLLVPSEEMGAAVLYFTGNDIFNRSMRLLARKKGMRLNQRGLYKDFMRTRGNMREKINEGTKIAGKDERGIFDALGVPWRECTERDC